MSYPSSETFPSAGLWPDLGAETSALAQAGLLLPQYKPNAATRHTLLSGIELSQNVLNFTATTSVTGWQTFRLPKDYQRGTSEIPDITGLQLCFDTTTGDFSANVALQVNEFGDWVTLAEGSILQNVVADEKEWIDVYFNNPIRVNQEWLGRQFRIGVQSDTPVWYSLPAVNSAETNDFAGDGQLAFKLLSFTADSGEDFLSNRYRSVVRRAAVSNFNTVATDRQNGFWYSKPNPSKYAVESLYFDVRDEDDAATVVDRLLLDPITPGVYFNLYYSVDGDEPGEDERDWETKLWTPVYRVYRMERRTEHALPEPVTAKYMKVEFSHLQAQAYQPGTFAQPIAYKKHPKWVLDYFMARLNDQQVTEDPFVARKVRVIYDALKLGYDYYVDDLQQTPSEPNTSDLATVLRPFLSTRSDVSDQIDDETLRRVREELRPFALQPASRSRAVDWLLAEYAQDTANPNYPVESMVPARADTSQVSQLHRERLVVEANFPVMFFYVPSRHTYRELEANFENDRAYFVGIRELAFTRDHYTVASDQAVYVENLADYKNVIRNDFIEEQYLPFNPVPNFMPDNSFEAGTTDWAAFTGTPPTATVTIARVGATDTSDGGDWALRVTRTAGGPEDAGAVYTGLSGEIGPGTYVWSAWVKADTALDIAIHADWIRDGVPESDANLDVYTTADDWQQISLTYTIPDGVITGGSVMVYMMNAANTNTFLLDNTRWANV